MGPLVAAVTGTNDLLATAASKQLEFHGSDLTQTLPEVWVEDMDKSLYQGLPGLFGNNLKESWRPKCYFCY